MYRLFYYFYKCNLRIGVTFPTGVWRSWANGCHFSHRGSERVPLFPPGSVDPGPMGATFPTGVRRSWANECHFSHRGPEIRMPGTPFLRRLTLSLDLLESIGCHSKGWQHHFLFSFISFSTEVFEKLTASIANNTFWAKGFTFYA